jgi:hypothetical protein
MARVAGALLRAWRRLPWRRALVAVGQHGLQQPVGRIVIPSGLGCNGPQPARPAHEVYARLPNVRAEVRASVSEPHHLQRPDGHVVDESFRPSRLW